MISFHRIPKLPLIALIAILVSPIACLSSDIDSAEWRREIEELFSQGSTNLPTKRMLNLLERSESIDERTLRSLPVSVQIGIDSLLMLTSLDYSGCNIEDLVEFHKRLAKARAHSSSAWSAFIDEYQRQQKERCPGFIFDEPMQRHLDEDLGNNGDDVSRFRRGIQMLDSDLAQSVATEELVNGLSAFINQKFGSSIVKVISRSPLGHNKLSKLLDMTLVQSCRETRAHLQKPVDSIKQAFGGLTTEVPHKLNKCSVYWLQNYKLCDQILADLPTILDNLLKRDDKENESRPVRRVGEYENDNPCHEVFDFKGSILEPDEDEIEAIFSELEITDGDFNSDDSSDDEYPSEPSKRNGSNNRWEIYDFDSSDDELPTIRVKPKDKTNGQRLADAHWRSTDPVKVEPKTANMWGEPSNIRGFVKLDQPSQRPQKKEKWRLTNLLPCLKSPETHN